MHSDTAHDLLAPSDLSHHLPEHHGLDIEYVETRVNVEAWMEARGIESTGDHDLDCLVMAHEMLHDDEG